MCAQINIRSHDSKALFTWRKQKPTLFERFSPCLRNNHKMSLVWKDTNVGDCSTFLEGSSQTLRWRWRPEHTGCNLQFFSELITTQLRISHRVTANSLYLLRDLKNKIKCDYAMSVSQVTSLHRFNFTKNQQKNYNIVCIVSWYICGLWRSELTSGILFVTHMVSCKLAMPVCKGNIIYFGKDTEYRSRRHY